MVYTHLKCRNKSLPDFKDSRQRVQEEEEKLPLELEGDRGKKERKKEPSKSRRLFVSVFIIFISSFLSARETPNSILSSTTTSQ